MFPTGPDQLLEPDVLQNIFASLKGGKKPSDLVDELSSSWVNMPRIVNRLGEILVSASCSNGGGSVATTEEGGESMPLEDILFPGDHQTMNSRTAPASFDSEILIQNLVGDFDAPFSKEERLHIDSCFIRKQARIIKLIEKHRSLPMLMEAIEKLGHSGCKSLFGEFLKEKVKDEEVGMKSPLEFLEDFFNNDLASLPLAFKSIIDRDEKFICILILLLSALQVRGAGINTKGAHYLHVQLSLVASISNHQWLQIYYCLHGIQIQVDLPSLPPPLWTVPQDLMVWLILTNKDLDTGFPLPIALGFLIYYLSFFSSPPSPEPSKSAGVYIEPTQQGSPSNLLLLRAIWSTPLLVQCTNALLYSPNQQIAEVISIFGTVNIDFLALLRSVDQHTPLDASVVEKLIGCISYLSEVEVYVLVCWINIRIFRHKGLAHQTLSTAKRRKSAGGITIFGELILLEELALRLGTSIGIPLMVLLVAHFYLIDYTDTVLAAEMEKALLSSILFIDQVSGSCGALLG